MSGIDHLPYQCSNKQQIPRKNLSTGSAVHALRRSGKSSTTSVTPGQSPIYFSMEDLDHSAAFLQIESSSLGDRLMEQMPKRIAEYETKIRLKYGRSDKSSELMAKLETNYFGLVI